LTNLEPGTSYFLADTCTKSEIITDKFDEENNPDKVDARGSISTIFYPGIVRTGFAITTTKFFVRIDYTSEMNTWNFIELFGDSERFDKIYKDFYEYYAKQALVSQNSKLLKIINDEITKFDKNINQLNTDISLDLNNLKASSNNLDDSIKSLDTKRNTFITDFKNNTKTIIDNYAKKYFFQNFIQRIFGENEYNDYEQVLQRMIDILNGYTTDLDNSVKDVDSNKCKFLAKSKYSALKSNVEQLNNALKNLLNLFNDAKKLLVGGKLSQTFDNTTTNGISVDGVKSIVNDFISNVTTDNFKVQFITGNLVNYYFDYADSNSTNKNRYFYKLINKIHVVIDEIYTAYMNLVTNFKSTTFYTYDNYKLALSEVDWKGFDNSVSGYNNYSSAKCFNNTDNIETAKYNASSTYITTMTISGKSTTTDNVLPDNYILCMNKIRKYVYNTFNLISKVEETTLILNEKSLRIKDTLGTVLKGLNSENNVKFEYNLNTYTTAASNSETTIKNAFDAYKAKMTDIIEKYKVYLSDYVEHYKDSLLKSFENKYYKKFTDLQTELQTDTAKILNEITTMQSVLKEELTDDLINRTKSIFGISNYQRIVYNYTYITQRLKIKYFERKKVEDDIEIIQNKIYEIQNKIPVDQGKLADLNHLKGAFIAVKNEIDNEIKTLTDEYNKIRTTYFGLKPIGNDDPNFDPGQYAVYDLDCLETAE